MNASLPAHSMAALRCLDTFRSGSEPHDTAAIIYNRLWIDGLEVSHCICRFAVVKIDRTFRTGGQGGYYVTTRRFILKVGNSICPVAPWLARREPNWSVAPKIHASASRASRAPPHYQQTTGQTTVLSKPERALARLSSSSEEATHSTS